MKLARVEVTRAHRLQALHSLRWRHPEWPADDEACLQDTHISRLIFGLALNHARTASQPGHVAPLHSPARAAPHKAPRVPHLRFDPRRAAANDHDD